MHGTDPRLLGGLLVSTPRRLFSAAVHRLPARVRGALQHELDSAAEAAAGSPAHRGGHGGHGGGGRPGGKAATLEAEFFQTVIADGDIDRAAVTLTRQLISGSTRRHVTPDLGRARAIMTGLQQYEDLRPAADICLALCSIPDLVPEVAWRLFNRNDLERVLRWAPVEYFQVGFGEDPDTAGKALRSVLDGTVPLETGPAAWLEIALAALAADRIDDADGALQRASAALGRGRGPKGSDTAQLRERADTLRQALERARAAAQPVEAPAGEVAFAAVGYRHPDRRSVSGDISDSLETLAALGHVARRAGVRFEGGD